MKKALLLTMLAFGVIASLQAQSRGPSFVKLNQPVSFGQANSVLRTSLNLSTSDEFRLTKTDRDNIGFTHYRLQQYYQGVPVDGCVYSMHEKGGKVTHLSGSYHTVGSLTTLPRISSAQALSSAMNYVGARKYAWQEPGEGFPEPKGVLVIWTDPEIKAQPRLAYKLEIYAIDPLSSAFIFVDAQTSQVLAQHARIHDADVPATGTSLYDGNVAFTADFTGSLYRLRQASSGSGIQTYSLNGSTSNYAGATDITSSTSNFTGDPTAVQAHYGAEKTHAYYIQNHGRNSYNGAGGLIRSYVRYGNNVVNAFWDGTNNRMSYGNGNGTTYGPVISLDITGHEITHGVTQYSANLVYQREPGALNESFSDIFGEMVEYFGKGSNDWLMGTEIGIGQSGAFRSMANPNLYGDPDTYGGTNWYNPNCSNPNPNTNDYCGVHINSGVQNKWFYILVTGESGTNDIGNAYNVTGIGRTKASNIAYRNLTVYLSSSSTFAAARTGAIQAAIDLYGAGSPEVIATTNAWYAVGVGSAYSAPDSQAPTAPTNLAASGTTSSSTSLNWTASTDNIGVTGYNINVNGSNVATSATNSFSLTGLNPSTTYSIYVTAYDAAGNVSGPSNTISVTTAAGSSNQLLLGSYFETGLGGWTDGGSDCARVRSTTNSYEGSYSMQLRDNSGTASSMTYNSLNVSGFSQIEIKFYFRAISFENGEDFWVQYNGGSGLATVASYAAGTSFNNNTFYVATIVLDAANYNFPTNAQFRFRADASANDDQVYIDQITITGLSGGALKSQHNSIRELTAGEILELAPVGKQLGGEVLVFPNPATDVIRIQTDLEAKSINIFNAEGKLMKRIGSSDLTNPIDVSTLKSGVYFLSVETKDGLVETKRFVKQ